MVKSHDDKPTVDPLRRKRSDLFIAIVIFAVALLVRSVYLIESSDNPTFSYPIVDSSSYHDMAVELSQNGQINFRFFWQPFFYPFFLSGVYAIAGPSVLAAKILQALLGTATCVLSYLLGQKVFSRPVGIAAGLIVAFYGPLIFFDTELLAAGFAAFWAVALCLLLLRAASKPTSKRCLFLGLCTVLAIITRPTFLPFCAAAWLWLIWQWARKIQFKRSLVFTSALLVGFAIVAIPLGACFKRETGKFTILPHSGGLNIYVGNNPNSRQTLIARPGWKWQQISEQANRQGIHGYWKEQEYFLTQVRQYIINHPAQFAAGIGRKALQFVSSREIPRNIDPYLFSRWSMVLWALNFKIAGFGFAFGLILPLALIGLIARRREVPAPIWFLLLTYPVAVIMVFVAGRYRVPIVPVLAVMAAAGGGFIIQTVRRKRWALLGLSALLIAGTVALGSVPGPFWEEQPNYEGEMYGWLGFQIAEEGDYDRAIWNYNQAIKLNPEDAEAYNNRGLAYQSKGQLDRAIKEFDIAIKLSPADPKPYTNRGAIYTNGGNFYQGLRDFDKAVELDPLNPQICYTRGNIYLIKGQYDRAIVDYNQAISLNPKLIEAYSNRARAYSSKGQLDLALSDLTQAIELNPTDAELYGNRGLVYKSNGKHDLAICDFKKAVQLAQASGRRELAMHFQKQLNLYKANRP